MMGSYGFLGWLALGLSLIVLEMLVVPGGFLLWLGLAALAMGAVTWVVPMAWTVELVLFALLSLVACLIAWKLHHGKNRATDAAEGLHERGAGLIGREFLLDQAIEGGFGRVRIDDTVWRVSGPELSVGTKVQVTGVNGATLVVMAG